MRALACVAVLTVFVLRAATASWAGPDDTPSAYTFCGWLDFWTQTFRYDDPEPGAYLALYARKMTCPSARRNYKRVRYDDAPPYQPIRRGYRCVTLKDGYEYADIRCSKKGKPKVAFRWQTGS